MSDTPRVTRIDLFIRPDNRVQVFKYPAGWNASTRPVASYISETSYDSIMAWFKENNWITRQWPGGARAFLNGTMAPVRSAGEIKRKREAITRYPPPGVQIHAVDLAYEL